MNINESAFPHVNRHGHKIEGMMLRDYFAAVALPAIMKDWYENGLMAGDDVCKESISMIAYHIADAMMEARK